MKKVFALLCFLNCCSLFAEKHQHYGDLLPEMFYRTEHKKGKELNGKTNPYGQIIKDLPEEKVFTVEFIFVREVYAGCLCSYNEHFMYKVLY